MKIHLRNKIAFVFLNVMKIIIKINTFGFCLNEVSRMWKMPFQRPKESTFSRIILSVNPRRIISLENLSSDNSLV